MKRDLVELLLGIGVLALGLGLLLFTFSGALALAANPGSFLQGQVPSQTQQTQGPSASFGWTSNGFNITVQDTSSQGSAGLTSWQWDFGDGVQTSGQNPGPHVYTNAGPYVVTLILQDGNNQESRAFAQVEIVPGQVRSGASMLDPTASLPNLNFDFGNILLPVSVGLLTMGMYLVMALVGGMVTKAGWNLIKPKPETVRVRLKPQHLIQAFEADPAATATTPASDASLPPPPP